MKWSNSENSIVLSRSIWVLSLWAIVLALGVRERAEWVFYEREAPNLWLTKAVISVKL
jgi:hypothetical protein